MMNNKQLLTVATKQLGNTGAKYRAYAGYGGSWCNMFVYWLFNANGCGALFPMKSAHQKTYCPTSIQWCNKNLAMIPPYLAMPCDIIYFDWDKNGNPNHIGIVESRSSTKVIKAIEGNTDGGKVARKTRDTKYVQAIFRPHFVPTGLKKERLAEDGAFEYKSVYMLQVALKITNPDGILGKQTVSALQKRAGCTADGAWGANTSRAVQKLIGLTGKAVDGQFGKQSTIALQKWINKQNGFTATTATKPKIHYFGHCANRKLDCVRIQFKYSSKAGNAKHWTYVAVWKDPVKAEKSAQFVEQCIARSPRIQYDDKPNLKKKLIANKGKMPSGVLTANCSNLMASAVYYASGKNIADKGAKNQKTQLKNSGLFNIYTDDRRKGYIQRGAIYGCDKHTGMSLGKK